MKAAELSKRLSATAILIGGMALLGPSSGRAVTLLSLVNPPAQTDTRYDLSFTATAPNTLISFGGYNDPAFEYVFDMSVTLGGRTIPINGPWVFTPASSGSEATEMNGLLTFGDISPGNYDTFSHTFVTTTDKTYLLSFHFANSLDGSSSGSLSSGVLVTTSGELGGALAVPELTTWTMALLGFVGLGLVGYRRGKTTQSRTPVA
jgi:hypothetical protein